MRATRRIGNGSHTVFGVLRRDSDMAYLSHAGCWVSFIFTFLRLKAVYGKRAWVHGSHVHPLLSLPTVSVHTTPSCHSLEP
ncbi:Uncharacterized protein TCM_005080 [Theobroma cacao]|uniref:Uncharacterized protein n=1 Tax=Theobroma cacao TaxID=3641 RepID=A0A061DTB3_THECC|nr:Uncharacterized protein TCM_005080 [Theobroma cacao]